MSQPQPDQNWLMRANVKIVTQVRVDWASVYARSLAVINSADLTQPLVEACEMRLCVLCVHNAHQTPHHTPNPLLLFTDFVHHRLF